MTAASASQLPVQLYGKRQVQQVMEKEPLLLITEGFPFGEREQSFLRTEFDLLAKNYRITILTQKRGDPILYPIPEDVRIETYSFVSNFAGSRIRLALELLSLPFRKEIRREIRTSRKGCTRQIRKERFVRIVSYYLNSRQLVNRISSLLRETGTKLIYTYWCTQATLAAAYLRKSDPTLKLFTRFHGCDLFQERAAGGWQPFRPFIAAQCRGLLFACGAGKNYFLSVWGMGWESKSIVAYLGCRPFPRIPAVSGQPLAIVSCSNMISLKRIDLIIDALALLPESIRVEWHHIGGGILEQELTQQAAHRLEQHKNIRWKFLGPVPNRELPRIYAEIRPQVFLTATSTEGGIPVSIQEAFAMGVPAIGTAVGGIPELISNGHTGFLLSPQTSAREIAGAISAFSCCSMAQRQQMSDDAFRCWQERCDAQKNAGRLLQILKSP
jgi:colanic acid/amylovoran biosynthesis glycosyltransferase